MKPRGGGGGGWGAKVWGHHGKRTDVLQQKRPTAKYENSEHDKLHKIYHKNIGKLWRTVENTTSCQYDPVGQVINLDEKTFTKATFQLLNKNIHFIPTSKVYIKHKLNE